MNFLVDAQLPRRMAAWLTAAGCDTVHTLDLSDGNRTTDEQINDVADREQRVVVKDWVENSTSVCEDTTMAIDEQTYQRWWNLHLRVARGDKLDSAEHAFYESVRQHLEGEETLHAPAPGLGALQAVIKSLESEHSGLEARRRQLETEIAALESALSKSIGRPLRVGN